MPIAHGPETTCPNLPLPPRDGGPVRARGFQLLRVGARSRAEGRSPLPGARASDAFCCLQWIQSSALHTLLATAAGQPSQTRTLKARHTLCPSPVIQEYECDLTQATGSGLLGHCVHEPVTAAAMSRFSADGVLLRLSPWPEHQVLAIISLGLHTGLPSTTGLASPGQG